MSLSRREASQHKKNHFPEIKGVDYIEFYTGNAFQAAHFYRAAFGFNLIACSGLETGLRDRESFVVEQNEVRFVLTSALSANGEIAEHVKLHGDSIKDIAFIVDDTARAFDMAVSRGARPVLEPSALEDSGGQVIKATVAAYGDTVHSFIQRGGYSGEFLPSFRAIQKPPLARSAGLLSIDHIAVSVKSGELDQWVDFYKQVLGFHQSHQEDVSTEYSAMNSKVVQNSAGLIKFPIVEPIVGRRKSQIDEYLTFHGGPGAQHIAALTVDIFATVKMLRANGIEFLFTPDSYYEVLQDRVGSVEEDIDQLRDNGILVDRDSWGYLMQIFTRPLQSRPTVFMEIVQRKGARGFGSGNIKALFQALEREQMRRGNL
jgi:4-hydroxyphenylpyruvate dioxygenase